jgi:four helix bundle protein
LRRASVSIPSNIAEGFGRRSKGEFLQFLGNASGSNFEVQTQLVIASELGFGEEAQRAKCVRLSVEVEKMLHSFARTVAKPKPSK